MNETPESDHNVKLKLEGIIENNQKIVETILKLATQDAEFRKRLLERPKEVLVERGMLYPPGTSVMVIEVPKNTIPLVVPPFDGRE
jgi:hypothetical protein